jgi:hypothetical protein
LRRSLSRQALAVCAAIALLLAALLFV